ncbi:MAG TPA: hypothetical protein VEB40_04870 [Flavipsychrobacter sp.]|nr:hypothetical protein [Flavipsychrobacter sp.]
MKQITLIAALAVFNLLAYTSCKKHETDLKKNKISAGSLADSVTIDEASLDGVTLTQYGFLKFDTPDDYEEILDIIKDYDEDQLNLWEQELGYVSSRTAFANPQDYGLSAEDNKNSVFEDEIFNTIIDPHGRIQIGDYLFKEEVDVNRLLEIHIEHYPGNLEAFDAGTFESNVMNEFDATFEAADEYDHICDYLATTEVVGLTKETGYTPPTWIFDPKETTSGDCTGGGVYVPTSGGPYGKHAHDNTDAVGTVWRADCKSVYQKVGVYFSIVAKMKYQKKSGSIWNSANTDMFILNNNGAYVSYCTYKPKNKSQQWPSIPYENYNNRKNDNVLTWRPYEGMRKLTLHDLDIWFAYIDNCGQHSGVHVRTNG